MTYSIHVHAIPVISSIYYPLYQYQQDSLANMDLPLESLPNMISRKNYDQTEYHKETRERNVAYGWMDWWMDKWKDGWMDGWIDGWMDGCMDRRWMRWMNGMDEWMSG